MKASTPPWMSWLGNLSPTRTLRRSNTGSPGPGAPWSRPDNSSRPWSVKPGKHQSLIGRQRNHLCLGQSPILFIFQGRHVGQGAEVQARSHWGPVTAEEVCRPFCFPVTHWTPGQPRLRADGAQDSGGTPPETTRGGNKDLGPNHAEHSKVFTVRDAARIMYTFVFLGLKELRWKLSTSARR